jgi:16S rRNA U516 pseudouridylate synthase RsuA-like enzyme
VRYASICHMKRTTVFLDEGLEREMRAMAESRGEPVASLVREALGRYVASEAKRHRPPLRFLAAGRSGKSDTAERHEELLFRELKPHGVSPQRTRRSRSG